MLYILLQMQRKSLQNVKSVACVMSKSGTKTTISGKMYRPPNVRPKI